MSGEIWMEREKKKKKGSVFSSNNEQIKLKA